MHKCFETEKILYLVLELLTGGELFDSIISKVPIHPHRYAHVARAQPRVGQCAH